MTKPVTLPTTAFVALTGNQTAALLDANYAALQTAQNDLSTYSNYFVDTGVANAYTAGSLPAGLTFSYVDGVTLQIKASSSNNGATTLNAFGSGAKPIVSPSGAALSGGEIVINQIFVVQALGSNWQLIASAPTTLLPRGHIDGFTMSTAGGSGTMSIAPGQADDSTHAYTLTTSSTFTKTQSAWVAGTGNGGLGPGSTAIGTNKWFHWYAILITGTGVVDFLFTDEYPTPTLPGAASKFRYIGSWTTCNPTDAGGLSNNWAPITQLGDEFWFNTIGQDANIGGNPIPATNLFVRTPLLVRTKAYLQVHITPGVAAKDVSFRVYDPALADVALVAGGSPVASQQMLFGAATVTPMWIGGQFSCWASTGQRVRVVGESSSGTVTIYLATLGYYNPRGRNG
jgi:hypothetical protein